MAFPLSHTGTMEFQLRGDPTVAVQQFYEEASFNINKSPVVTVDGSIDVTAASGRLIVNYNLKFKPLFLVSIVLVSVMFGLSLAVGDSFHPEGYPRAWGTQRTLEMTAPSILREIGFMVLIWLWLFGGNYVYAVLKFRSLLKQTWKRMILPSDGLGHKQK